ncbi:conserved hypothetical protein [Methanolacinia petrolearia DSM 11571]|uniref:4Fe-4S ferredoxin-type domain-containing protein n=1 Tax=Methanolacinia petrolearia (strain DSM 11571 / OCM 486 / SEBR 4847) TaxID=679926 RepID=E1RHT4_METP4|nr:hypothetical protein [Methanolacinia petrolearia]ADN36472.1 conserved hypothetical protein [Methanolacinia petrolearia DSM 11571]
MKIPEEAIKKALELGADVAGFVPAKKMIGCPSELSAGPQGFSNSKGSFLVLGLYHDPEKPEMDWWEEKSSTPGDRILHRITTEISRWLGEVHGIDAHDIPYQIHDGGIYLKDAAVLAGLGKIGKNNLVIVPGFGPKVRFRALWADLEVPEPGIIKEFLFCEKCSRICHRKCPMDAFPNDSYSRERCLKRIDLDKSLAAETARNTGKGTLVDHCRTCELVCPMGR